MLELENKIAALATSMGYVLYDMFWAKENEHAILRIFLSKELPSQSLEYFADLQNAKSIQSQQLDALPKRDSISLQDCELFSKALSPLLDVELVSQEKYFLEVSSPGLERVLKKPQHFVYSIGEEIEITSRQNIHLQGLLLASNVNGEVGALLLCTEYLQQYRIEFVPFENIKKAKTIFRF